MTLPSGLELLILSLAKPSMLASPRGCSVGVDHYRALPSLDFDGKDLLLEMAALDRAGCAPVASPPSRPVAAG